LFGVFFVSCSYCQSNFILRTINFAPYFTLRELAYDRWRNKVPRLEQINTIFNGYPANNGIEQGEGYELTGVSRVNLAVRCHAPATINLFALKGAGMLEADTKQVDVMTTNDYHSLVNINVNKNKTPASIASPYENETTGEQWSPPRPRYLGNIPEVPDSSLSGYAAIIDGVTEINGKTVKFETQSQAVHPWTFWYPQDGAPSVDVATLGGYQFQKDVPSITTTINSFQEWTMPRSGEGHPFHHHVNHMQIVKAGGCLDGVYEEYQFYDTVSTYSDECVVRFQYIDFGGRVIMHCHNLYHGDAGMMGWTNVIDGNNYKDVPPMAMRECEALQGDLMMLF
jgi:hypothetical protein